MPKLYELTDNYLKVLEMAQEDEDGYLDTLESIEFEIEEKADGIAKVLAELNGDVNMLKAEEERLYNKRKAIENNAKKLKTYLEEQMILLDKKKFKTELFSFNVQKNAPSLEVAREDNIPEEFYITERKLQRSELLKAIKEGLEVEGIGLKQSESLRIK